MNTQTLNLSYNAFLELPLCLCEILTLTKLQLSGNKITGPLPIQIGNLTELQTLQLDGNFISAIPNEVNILFAISHC